MITEEALVATGWTMFEPGHFDSYTLLWEKWIRNEQGQKLYAMHIENYNTLNTIVGSDFYEAECVFYLPTKESFQVEYGVCSHTDVSEVEEFYKSVYLNMHCVPVED